MNVFNGFRVIESALLVRDGEPRLSWVPAGRSGWKVKRMVTPKEPYAVRLDATTMVMHPALVRAIRELPSGVATSYGATHD
jgi:hypothetical protein